LNSRGSSRNSNSAKHKVHISMFNGIWT
jgi:hypothetical protein